MTLRTHPSLSRRRWRRLGAAVWAITMLVLLTGLGLPGQAGAAQAATLQSTCSQGSSNSFTCYFVYTGRPELLTVPAGVSSITVIADGAVGGPGSSSTGGYGDEAQARFAVTPGAGIEVVVGGPGEPYYSSAPFGGFNGGGDGGMGAQGAAHSGVNGGGGGGASDVRFGSCAAMLNCKLADRVLVAGGGGGSVGGSSTISGRGGGGGFPSGGLGDSGSAPNGGGGGRGGGQAGVGGGGAADPNSACTAHPAGGGDGGTPDKDQGGAGGGGGTIYPGTNSANGGNGGGGGGGGYWGGGGGGGSCGYRDIPGAGGGGSSYGPPGTTFANNSWPGSGRVIITTETPDAPTVGHAVPGDSTARVTFAPGYNGGFPISAYTVMATDRTDPARGGQTATGPGGPLTVTGLTNGDSYTFTVTATNTIGTGPPSAASSPVTPNPLVYVSNQLPASPPTCVAGGRCSVTAWAQGVTGNAEPFSVLSLPYEPAGLAVSQSGGLWVANPDNNSVAEYANGATGEAPPIRTISGGDTGLNEPDGLAVDQDGNVWVANYRANSVTEYAVDAKDNAQPMIKIQDTDTKLSSPMGVAVDQAGNVWVANSGTNGHSTVTEYAKGATGDAPPAATITAGVAGAFGVAVGPDGNVWVANLVGGGNVGSVGSVTEYAKPIPPTGAKPITTLTNGNGVVLPAGVALNQAGDLFVANGYTGAAGMTEYAKPIPPTGAKPTTNITGGATGLNQPFGIAVDDAPLVHEGAPLRVTHIAAGAGQHRHAVAGVTFTDTDPGARLSQFSGTIAWGDGTTTAIPRRNFFKRPGGKFAAGGGHTYAKPGTYTITITIRDTDGAKAKASTKLKVTGPSTSPMAGTDP
jgi:hypothetical protein